MMRRVQGFTLIETVVAFAILGLSLTVLYASFQNALLRARHDARFSEATLLARSLLARAGTEWPLIDGTRTGQWNGFTYELNDEMVTAPPNEPALTLPSTLVSVRVTWSEFAGSREIVLSTLKLSRGSP